MALVVEQAGGMASTGPTRALEVNAEMLHQRRTVILGSGDEMSVLLEMYQS